MVKLTNFDHLTTVIFEFWPWSWSKMAIFDHLTTAILKFWPWSWSKIFNHLTMTPGRRPNGQKIVVILPPPPPNYSTSKYLYDTKYAIHILQCQTHELTYLISRTLLIRRKLEIITPDVKPIFVYNNCTVYLNLSV